MKWKAVSKLILSLGAMTMLLGTAAASTSASSSTAIRLLRDIKTDAAKIQSVAARWEGLTKTSGTTWLRYDRQWNEIKPAQEDMQIKLWRLEGMQAALSPVERAELDQSKPMIEQIQMRTHELRKLLDKPGIQTSDTKFKAYATSLRQEAHKLEQTSSAS